MPRSKDLTLADRDEQVIRMAAEGYTQRQIGATLGISGARVNQIIKDARETTDDDGTRDRLAVMVDMLLQKTVVLATGAGRRMVSPSGKPVYEVDHLDSRGQPVFDLSQPIYDEYATLEAMDKAVKLMDRYAKLYGLDRPRQKDKDESQEYNSALEYVRQLAQKNRELLTRLDKYERGDIVNAEVIDTTRPAES